MIIPDIPARMVCAEKDCATSPIRVEFCLLSTGGFAFRPLDEKEMETWQIGAGSNGVFMCFCPLHKKETSRLVQVGPSGPRVAARRNGH